MYPIKKKKKPPPPRKKKLTEGVHIEPDFLVRRRVQLPDHHGVPLVAHVGLDDRGPLLGEVRRRRREAAAGKRDRRRRRRRRRRGRGGRVFFPSAPASVSPVRVEDDGPGRVVINKEWEGGRARDLRGGGGGGGGVGILGPPARDLEAEDLRRPAPRVRVRLRPHRAAVPVRRRGGVGQGPEERGAPRQAGERVKPGAERPRRARGQGRDVEPRPARPPAAGVPVPAPPGARVRGRGVHLERGVEGLDRGAQQGDRLAPRGRGRGRARKLRERRARRHLLVFVERERERGFGADGGE